VHVPIAVVEALCERIRYRGRLDGGDCPDHNRIEWIWKDLHDNVTRNHRFDPVIYNTLARLIDLPSEEEGVFASRKISLSADAREEFEKFLKRQHDHRDMLEGREREWVSKCPSHVLRLAGTLAYLDWAATGDAEPSRIEATFVDAAIRLVTDYFWPHSRAALRQIGLSERHVNARRVLKWVRANRKIEVSREEIRREALGQALDAAATDALLDALSKAGWCRPIKSIVGKSGGRPALRWHFNPLLYGSPAETAETLFALRRRDAARPRGLPDAATVRLKSIASRRRPSTAAKRALWARAAASLTAPSRSPPALESQESRGVSSKSALVLV
jgi:hypothetical protein